MVFGYVAYSVFHACPRAFLTVLILEMRSFQTLYEKLLVFRFPMSALYALCVSASVAVPFELVQLHGVIAKDITPLSELRYGCTRIDIFHHSVVNYIGGIIRKLKEHTVVSGFCLKLSRCISRVGVSDPQAVREFLN